MNRHVQCQRFEKIHFKNSSQGRLQGKLELSSEKNIIKPLSTLKVNGMSQRGLSCSHPQEYLRKVRVRLQAR